MICIQLQFQMVRMAGFEPALSWSRTKHFTKLSYILRTVLILPAADGECKHKLTRNIVLNSGRLLGGILNGSRN